MTAMQLKTITSFSVILGAALSGGRLASWFRLPMISGFLLTGLLAGPSLLGFLGGGGPALPSAFGSLGARLHRLRGGL